MQEDMMLQKKIWAVVGASENKEKYGYKIYKKLKSRGYQVYPVNPNYETVDGDTCYRNLGALPELPEVVDMVVAPKHGKGTILEAAELGVQNIWLQPGTYNDELLQLIDEKELTAVQACVLVALR